MDRKTFEARDRYLTASAKAEALYGALLTVGKAGLSDGALALLRDMADAASEESQAAWATYLHVSTTAG